MTTSSRTRDLGSDNVAAPPTFPFLRPPVEDDEIGRFGEYRVLRMLSQGGMGIVFHAEDVALKRPVALKVVKPGLDGDIKPAQRFLREARALAAIKHDHVVTVYRAGQEGDVVYLTMELLEGQSLEEFLVNGCRVEPAELVRLGREIAAGLAVIHEHGLIHRDIKPANLWLEPCGTGRRMKILDFGLARLIGDDSRLTQTGMVVGTPAFMSPEQARGEVVDARSDLFSLGCVLYALCTGAEPFPGPNTMARLTALAVDDPKPIDELNPATPSALVELVTQLLEKNPDHRPASAAEVVTRLEGIAAPRPRRRGKTRKLKEAPERPKGGVGRLTWAVVAAGALLLVGGVGGLAFAVLSHKPPAGVGGQAAPAFLSEWKPVASSEWPPSGPPGSPAPPNPFTFFGVNGVRPAHALGMHASPRGLASVSYSLKKQYNEFAVDVSLNDTSPRSPMPLTFSVHGDGKLLWQSKPVVSRDDTQSCRISVEGVDELKLTLTNDAVPPHGVGGAHGLWVDPRVGRLKGDSP